MNDDYRKAKAHALELMNDSLTLTSIYNQAKNTENQSVIKYLESWFSDRAEEVRDKFTEELKYELDHGIDSYSLEDCAAQLRRIEDCIDDTDFEELEEEANKLGA